MAGNAIRAHDVRMTYGSGASAVHALKGVSLELAQGEIMLMMGPSGSGKTTFLSILGGILTPTGGEVFLEGTRITGLHRRELARFRLEHVGFIFQGFNLFGALTARENVELSYNIRGVGGRHARADAMRLLERLGIGAQAQRLPRDLSGGEKQRVAIARALAGNPRVMMADEPTSSLDADHGRAVVEMLRELARERGTTVLIVAHDERIKAFADRVVELNDGHF